MSEKDPWNSFYKTGKIEDYIKYSQAKKHHVIQNAVNPGAENTVGGDLQTAGVFQGNQDDNYTGLDNKGAGSGGK